MDVLKPSINKSLDTDAKSGGAWSGFRFFWDVKYIPCMHYGYRYLGRWPDLGLEVGWYNYINEGPSPAGTVTQTGRLITRERHALPTVSTRRRSSATRKENEPLTTSGGPPWRRQSPPLSLHKGRGYNQLCALNRLVPCPRSAPPFTVFCPTSQGEPLFCGRQSH